MRCTIFQIYLINTLYVLDRSTVNHQKYLNTVYTQKVFVMLVLLVSASVVRMHGLLNVKFTNAKQPKDTYTLYNNAGNNGAQTSSDL
jgi:hypothetical protein